MHSMAAEDMDIGTWLSAQMINLSHDVATFTQTTYLASISEHQHKRMQQLAPYGYLLKADIRPRRAAGLLSAGSTQYLAVHMHGMHDLKHLFSIHLTCDSRNSNMPHCEEAKPCIMAPTYMRQVHREIV
jgi:hypothetical protein